jgi:membrane-bound serine protease (ClpP class)
LAVELQGAITPVSDDIVLAAIGAAEAEEALALMILLDTPGGGLAETTEILRQMEETKLPVIVYVYPEDAFAWSAGTIILSAPMWQPWRRIPSSAQLSRCSSLPQAEQCR